MISAFRLSAVLQTVRRELHRNLYDMDTKNELFISEMTGCQKGWHLKFKSYKTMSRTFYFSQVVRERWRDELSSSHIRGELRCKTPSDHWLIITSRRHHCDQSSRHRRSRCHPSLLSGWFVEGQPSPHQFQVALLLQHPSEFKQKLNSFLSFFFLSALFQRAPTPPPPSVPSSCCFPL